MLYSAHVASLMWSEQRRRRSDPFTRLDADESDIAQTNMGGGLIAICDSTVCSGRGIFARTFIPRDSYVTAYAGRWFSKGEERAASRVYVSDSKDYVYECDDGSIIDGSASRRDATPGFRDGSAQWANDVVSPEIARFGQSNNCHFVEVVFSDIASKPDRKVYLRASRDIGAGEELLAAYGLSYWLHKHAEKEREKQQLTLALISGFNGNINYASLVDVRSRLKLATYVRKNELAELLYEWLSGHVRVLREFSKRAPSIAKNLNAIEYRGAWKVAVNTDCHSNSDAGAEGERSETLTEVKDRSFYVFEKTAPFSHHPFHPCKRDCVMADASARYCPLYFDRSLPYFESTTGKNASENLVIICAACGFRVA